MNQQTELTVIRIHFEDSHLRRMAKSLSSMLSTMELLEHCFISELTGEHQLIQSRSSQILKGMSDILISETSLIKTHRD